MIKNGADITIKNQKNLSFIDLWQSDKIKAIIDKIKKTSGDDIWYADNLTGDMIQKEKQKGNLYLVKDCIDAINIMVEEKLIDKNINKNGSKYQKSKI